MTTKNYISESGRVDTEINAFIESRIQNGTMIVMTTEKFDCFPQGKIEDVEHLLELRIFTISDSFTYRIIEDDSKEKYDAIDEDQYLDINTQKSTPDEYTYIATGGGSYHLPIKNAEKVRIRNYISFDEHGIAQITDFRVVKFLRGGEK